MVYLCFARNKANRFIIYRGLLCLRNTLLLLLVFSSFYINFYIGRNNVILSKFIDGIGIQLEENNRTSLADQRNKIVYSFGNEKSTLRTFIPVDCQQTLRDYRGDKWKELHGIKEIDESYIKRTITYHPFLVSTHSAKLDHQRSFVFGTGKYYETILTSIIEEAYNETTTKEEIFIDVGGNIGWFSLLAASMGARVYSFEPNILNIVRFCESIELNAFGDAIHLFRKGVGEEHNKTKTLYKSKNVSPGEGSLVVPIFNPKLYGQIQLVTLDALAEEEGWFHTLQPIKFLKIDVEGYEDKVIQGGKNLIKAKLIENIILEFKHIKGTNMEDRKIMVKTLLEAGYELYKRGGFKGPANLVTKKYTKLKDMMNDLEGNPTDRSKNSRGQNLWFRVKV